MFRTRVRVKVIRLLSEPPARRRKVDIPNNPNTRGMFVQSGLSAVARVKKAGVNCMHCSMPIPKGDIRFEFVWKINKPPRSIHTTCLNQLDEQTCAGSTRFLETLLSQNPPNDSEELQACKDQAQSQKMIGLKFGQFKIQFIFRLRCWRNRSTSSNTTCIFS